MMNMRVLRQQCLRSKPSLATRITSRTFATQKDVSYPHLYQLSAVVTDIYSSSVQASSKVILRFTPSSSVYVLLLLSIDTL